jgi:hypothetical protein
MADVSSGTPEEFPSDCPEPIIKAAVWRGGRTAWKTTDYFRHKAEQCPIASPPGGARAQRMQCPPGSIL